MVPEAEWAFWMDDGQTSRAPEGMRAAFENVRRVFGPIAKEVCDFTDATEVVPGIRAMAAPGTPRATPRSWSTTATISCWVWSDITNKPELFVRHPAGRPFDMDGEQAVATRLRRSTCGERAARVAGFHFPFPATGHIACRVGDGYDYVPVFWRAT